MNLISLLQELNERTDSSGQRSNRSSIAAGDKNQSYDSKERVSPQKSRVKIYKSISDALKHGYYGQIFSTVAANRLYVITRPTWGDKSRASGNNKVAKGFSDTIPNSFKDVKQYAMRTMEKHGSLKDKSSKDKK